MGVGKVYSSWGTETTGRAVGLYKVRALTSPALLSYALFRGTPSRTQKFKKGNGRSEEGKEKE